MCSEIFWFRKILCLRERERGGGEGVLGFFIQKLLPHSTDNLPRWNLLFFMIFFEREFFYGEEVEGKGGISLFSVENMLYHSTERLRRGNFPSVSQSLSGIENKSLHIRGTGGLSLI